MLTPRQEVFCQNIIKGLHPTEAYFNAYDCKNRNTAQVEGFNLMHKDYIVNRLNELYKPIKAREEAEQLNKKQQMIDFIQSRIEVCKNNQDENNIVRYTDMLNKIYGTYKVEQDNTKSNSNLHNLSMDKLQKIVDFDVS